MQGVIALALSHAILATLLDGPVSGYALMKRFNSAIGYFWQASHQQIYRELATLEHQGQVERMPTDGQTTTIRYALTEAGRSALTTWVMQPSEPGVMREDVLLKVRAGQLVPPATLLAELRHRRDLHAKRLLTYQELQLRNFSDPEHLSYEQCLHYLPLMRGVLFETENVHWCEQAIQMLENARQLQSGP